MWLILWHNNYLKLGVKSLKGLKKEIELSEEVEDTVATLESLPVLPD